jgi:2-polyprenyl-3-methyl-5-hydroxy-6-metoxy-1,4-benzoquinol methylase
MHAIPTAPGQVWPACDLEAAPLCEVCGSDARARWLSGLQDRVYRVAPGKWTLWRCSGCDAAQLDPRPTPDSIARAYGGYHTHKAHEKHFLVQGDRPDLWLKRAMHLSFYNRRFGHGLAGALPLGWLAVAATRRRSARAGQFIRHLPGPATGADLLDVGCGDGGFLRVARALGFRVRGIEFDPEAALQVCAQGFDVSPTSIAESVVAEASLDHITLSHVIEHLHGPVDELKRMRQWLRPGGRIWVQTPNGRGAGAERYGADWRGLEPPRHLVIFGPESLRMALNRSGFERVSLLPPQVDSEFFIGQSEAIRAGRDPYRQSRPQRRAARREGRTWDRAALSRPERAESITMVGFRPARG